MVGGPGAPGILVVKRRLLSSALVPTQPGGGTVFFVTSKCVSMGFCWLLLLHARAFPRLPPGGSVRARVCRDNSCRACLCAMLGESNQGKMRIHVSADMLGFAMTSYAMHLSSVRGA